MVHTPTLLAAPITTAMLPLRDQARFAQLAGADLIELRIDLIGDIAAVRQMLAGPRELPVILTIRLTAEGGKCGDSDAARAVLFEQL